MYDVIVVGGRVAGARTAGLLAKKGANVLLIDSRENISNPVQCTGFVSHRFLELLPQFPKKNIYNKISQAKFYSPNNSSIMLKAKSFAVIDRGKLDDWLIRNAKKLGVKIKTGVIFESRRLHKEYIEILTNKGTFKAKLLVGADGPGSAVANSCAIKTKPQFYGIQATVKGKFNDNFAELHFGSKVAPKYFAWVVPINKTSARIGLATKHKTYSYFKTFTKEKLGYVPKPDVSGAIKCQYQSQITSERVLLVGDAASQVKPFSGGGIIYSLIASELCSSAIMHSLRSEKFDKNFLAKHYQKRAHIKLRSPIIRGLLLYRLWQSLPDFAMDIIFWGLNKTNAYKLIEKVDVDFY